MKAILALEDGRTFEGQGFGASGEVEGEVRDCDSRRRETI